MVERCGIATTTPLQSCHPTTLLSVGLLPSRPTTTRDGILNRSERRGQSAHGDEYCAYAAFGLVIRSKADTEWNQTAPSVGKVAKLLCASSKRIHRHETTRGSKTIGHYRAEEWGRQVLAKDGDKVSFPLALSFDRNAFEMAI